MSERRMGRRSKKSAERWKASFNRQRELSRQIQAAAGDILVSPNFQSTRVYIQHGNMTVNAHCMSVARCSLAISDRLKLSCSRQEMIRGALLHDYFLYDWHTKGEGHRLHGFSHPGTALRNACREYDLTPREQEIIKKHMWPLTVVPPTCREAWIVSMADKWCSLLETMHIHKGHGAYVEFSLKKEPEKASEEV